MFLIQRFIDLKQNTEISTIRSSKQQTWKIGRLKAEFFARVNSSTQFRKHVAMEWPSHVASPLRTQPHFQRSKVVISKWTLEEIFHLQRLFLPRFSYCNWGHPILVIFLVLGDDETTKPGIWACENILELKTELIMLSDCCLGCLFHPKKLKIKIRPYTCNWPSIRGSIPLLASSLSGRHLHMETHARAPISIC